MGPTGQSGVLRVPTIAFPMVISILSTRITPRYAVNIQLVLSKSCFQDFNITSKPTALMDLTAKMCPPFPPCPVSSVPSFECTGPCGWKLWQGQAASSQVSDCAVASSCYAGGYKEAWSPVGSNATSPENVRGFTAAVGEKEAAATGWLISAAGKLHQPVSHCTNSAAKPGWVGTSQTAVTWFATLRASVALPIYRERQVKMLWFFLQLKMTTCGVT